MNGILRYNYSVSVVLGFASVMAFSFLYDVFGIFVEAKDVVKRAVVLVRCLGIEHLCCVRLPSQHANATYCNIVGRNMLRAFGHRV